MMLFLAFLTTHLSLSSQSASWDHLSHRLTLEGDVHLVDPSQLDLVSDRVLLIHQGRELSHVTASGITFLTLSTKGVFSHPTLRCTGTLDLDPAIGLIRGSGPLRFSDEGITLSGQSGQLMYRNDLLETLYLEGNVRLISTRIQNQPCYALAEKLTYLPGDQTLILSSDAPKRVLFWQERDSMCLSATELHIRHDAVTHRDSIQGFGDVHFSFEPNEQDAISQLFLQHHL